MRVLFHLTAIISRQFITYLNLINSSTAKLPYLFLLYNRKNLFWKRHKTNGEWIGWNSLQIYIQVIKSLRVLFHLTATVSRQSITYLNLISSSIAKLPFLFLLYNRKNLFWKRHKPSGEWLDWNSLLICIQAIKSLQVLFHLTTIVSRQSITYLNLIDSSRTTLTYLSLVHNRTNFFWKKAQAWQGVNWLK